MVGGSAGAVACEVYFLRSVGVLGGLLAFDGSAVGVGEDAVLRTFTDGDTKMWSMREGV